MKLLYLADTSNVHTQKWVKYFSELGAKITCVSFSETELPNTKHFIINKRIVSKINPSLSLFKKISYLKHFKEVRNFIHTEKPDILHAHYASSYGFLGNICNFHPFILSVWGSDVFIFPKKSFLTKKIFENNLKKADFICSTSFAMAKEINLYTNKKILITPFGVETSFFQPLPKTPNEKILIGTIKSLEKIYGIDTLILAFKILSEKFPNIILRIIGSGTQKKNYVKLAYELGLENRVEFLGRILNKEVPKHLSEFDIFLALSDSESFGVAVIEASSCEIPVIVSNVGGLPEVVKNGETGIIINPKAPEEAAIAIEKLISDKNLREKMGKNGRKFVLENYDWQENAKIMLELYQKILEKKND